jgi:hypothetical protein
MSNAELDGMKEKNVPLVIGASSFFRHSSLEIRHCQGGDRPRAGKWKWWTWSWATILLLGGYLLFAHGCHPDEDTELFTSAVSPMSGER